MTRWKAHFAGVIAVAASTLAYADCDKDPECDSPTSWNQFTNITLSLSEPGSPGTATLKAAFDHETYDFTIDLDFSHPEATVKGTAGMVQGRVMLTKGMKLNRGTEIDTIDAPLLSIKLAMIVLGRIFPKGPEALTAKAPIDYVGKAGIKYATPSASGYVAAPWRVVGEARKLEAGTVSFDLVLTLPPGDKRGEKSQATRMTGQFSMRKRPVFDDQESLDGWTLYGVGPQVEKRGGSTILDYGAKPESNPRLKTIADIRAHIAEEQNPGKPDPSKNFTGFWKEKCDQAFGLQIKPFGNDGKYSIVFCGPGGCGDPANSRHTFITGDKRFEVVSEDEIFQVDGSGKKERQVRCTKDTNPVLKYR